MNIFSRSILVNTNWSQGIKTNIFDIVTCNPPYIDNKYIKNLPKAKDIDGEHKIAVFHGGVGRFEVDTGLWMSDDNVNANNFAG